MGRIVHAVICPEGTDPSILKEVYGEKWPDEFPKAVQEDSGTSVTYVLAQKSEFAQIDEPQEIVLKDGKTKVQVITGDLKSGAKSDGVIDVSVDTVSNTYEWNITVGEFLDDEMWKFSRIMWAALAQDSATVEQRSRIIMGALDGLRTAIEKALAKAGEQTVEDPGSTKSEMPFGSGDMLSKVVSELKHIKKFIGEQAKSALKVEIQKDNENGGNNTMTEYATKEEFNGLKDGMADLSKKFDTIMDKLAPPEEPVVTPPVQPETATKSDADVIAEKVGAMLKPIAEKVEALESVVNDTAAKTEILQKSGPAGSVAEDTNKPSNSAKSECTWASHPAFAGR